MDVWCKLAGKTLALFARKWSCSGTMENPTRIGFLVFCLIVREASGCFEWSKNTSPLSPCAEFTEAPWNTETDENKNLRRYASMMRQSLIFQLVSCLGISWCVWPSYPQDNILGRCTMLLMHWKPSRTTHMIIHHSLMLAGPTLRFQNFNLIWQCGAPQTLKTLSLTFRALPHPGPAVGLGGRGGPRPVGQNLEAVLPQVLSLDKDVSLAFPSPLPLSNRPLGTKYHAAGSWKT